MNPFWKRNSVRLVYLISFPHRNHFLITYVMGFFFNEQGKAKKLQLLNILYHVSVTISFQSEFKYLIKIDPVLATSAFFYLQNIIT